MAKSQWQIYKKSGALQLNMSKPQYEKTSTGFETISRHGAVFVDMAKGSDGVIDWTNKVLFAIGPNDISKILYAFAKWQKTGTIDLVLEHFPIDGDKKKKSFSIKNGSPGTYMVGSFYDGNSATIFFDAGEMLYFYEIIKRATTYIMLGS